MAQIHIIGGFYSHGEIITSIAWVGNDRIVSAARECGLKLWRVSDHKPLREYLGHGDSWVNCVTWLGDNRMISGAVDMIMWDIDTGAQLAVFRGHTNAVYDIILLDDGKRIASCGNDNTVRIWSLETQECLLVLPRFKNCVGTLVQATHDLLMVGVVAHPTKVWNLSENKEHGELGYRWGGGQPAGPGRVKTIDHEARVIQVWDVETLKCVYILKPHGISIGASLMLGDDKIIIVDTSKGNSLTVWDIARMDECLAVTSTSGDRLHFCQGITSMILLPNGDIVTGADDGTMRHSRIDWPAGAEVKPPAVDAAAPAPAVDAAAPAPAPAPAPTAGSAAGSA